MGSGLPEQAPTGSVAQATPELDRISLVCFEWTGNSLGCLYFNPGEPLKLYSVFFQRHIALLRYTC